MDKEQIKNFWNNVATSSQHKDKKNSGMLGPGTRFFEDCRKMQEEKVFHELIDLTNVKNVLEVGCGGGRWSFYLSKKVEFIKGIDISKDMIALSKKIAKEQNVQNVEFEEIDFLDLPEDRKYDLVYFSGVLMYIDDESVVKILQKLKSIIHNDSIILRRDTVQTQSRITKNDNYPVVYRTLEEYNKLFKNSNYPIVQSKIAYKIPRFSSIIDKFYNPPLMNLNFALFIGSILNSINKLLGNPKWLMRKNFYELQKSGNTQEHIFTVYKREI